MGQGTRKLGAAHDIERVWLGELIHEHVRVAIETVAQEELRAALAVQPYERHEARRGYRYVVQPKVSWAAIYRCSEAAL